MSGACDTPVACSRQERNFGWEWRRMGAGGLPIMAPVRQDAPHRPALTQTAVTPGAQAPRPAQAAGQKARPALARPIADGFDPAKSRNLISRPSDTFRA